MAPLLAMTPLLAILVPAPPASRHVSCKAPSSLPVRTISQQ